jgi:hypothetical protein
VGGFDKEFTAAVDRELSAQQTSLQNNGIEPDGGGVFIKPWYKVPVSAFVPQDPNLGSLVKVSFRGRKSLEGMTLSSDFLWDLQFKPYWDDKVDADTPANERFVPSVVGKNLRSYVPPLPRSVAPVFLNNSVGSSSEAASNLYSDGFIPIIEYEFGQYEITSEDIEVHNGMKLDFFSGVTFNWKLELTIVEDDDRTWSRYFDEYFESVFNRHTNSVAPYKQSCFRVRLYVYGTKLRYTFYRDVLVIPTQYTLDLEGGSDPSGQTSDLRVTFGIVGDFNYRDEGNSYESNYSKVNPNNARPIPRNARSEELMGPVVQANNSNPPSTNIT